MDEKLTRRHHDLLERVQALSRLILPIGQAYKRDGKVVPVSKEETGLQQWHRVLELAKIDVFNPWREEEDMQWRELLRIWEALLDYETQERLLAWTEWVEQHYPQKEKVEV